VPHLATKEDRFGCLFAVHNRGGRGSAPEETMIGGMTAFAIAVGGTSLVCHVLMSRLQNRRGNL
jgi:hypothetical protein